MEPTYANIKRGQLGCIYCAERGIAADARAVVYLIVHEAFDAVKVGIAVEGSERVLDHVAFGWEVRRLWDGLTGNRARELEREILRWWRNDLGLPYGVPADLMPQAGYTETAPLHLVNIDEVIERVDKTRRIAAEL